VLLTAKNPGHLALMPGQMVELPWGGFFSPAAAALLFPAAGFIAGYSLIPQIFPLSAEGPRAAAGVLFMFLFGLGFYLFRRRFPAGALPRIKSVLP
jgi:hypothetical protein